VFSEIGDVIYNVFPDKTGELVTGRVLDACGEPVPKATVTARTTYIASKGASATTFSETLETSASGHYALFIPREISSSYSCSVALSAAQGLAASTNSVKVTVKASQSHENANLDTLTWDPCDPSIGNSWGNDLYLASAGVEAEAASFTAFSPGAGGEISFTGTPGASYQLQCTFSLDPQDWRAITNILVPESGVVTFPMPDVGDSPSAFFRIVSE
jgi:hypothetical protein